MPSRREFMKAACGAGAATLCGGLSFTIIGCSTVPTITPFQEGNDLRFSEEAFADQTFVIVETGFLKSPIAVHKNEDGSYTAVLLRCTHKACRPQVFEYSLDCPCHGSQFDFDGTVLKGPAEVNLKSFPITKVGEGNLVISLEP